MNRGSLPGTVRGDGKRIIAKDQGDAEEEVYVDGDRGDYITAKARAS